MKGATALPLAAMMSAPNRNRLKIIWNQPEFFADFYELPKLFD
jgi:hypothetical protein